MTVRIDLLRKEMTSLDNMVLQTGDIVKFKNIADLAPPIPERMALLKISESKDVISGLGMKIDENTYIVQEL